MLIAIGIGWIAAVTTVDSGYPSLVVPFVLAGVGMGLTFAPLANLALSGVSRDEQGIASGASNTVRELGVAVLGSVFAANGGYGDPASFVAGSLPAVTVGAVAVALGAVAALFLPRAGATR